MGNFYVNHQVRADSAEPVVAMARRVCCGLAYVAPSRNGWVGVFDEASNRQDDPMIHQVGQDLSARLGTAVFGFLVHDSDVLKYVLFESGQPVAEFDSWPDYDRTGGESEAGDTPSAAPKPHPDQPMLFDIGEPVEPPTPGNPEAVLRHCVRGTMLRQVRDLLRPDSWPSREAAWNEGREEWLDAFERHARLAELLGIDEERAHLGFRHIEERLDWEGRQAVPGIRKIRGKGTSRPLKTIEPPRSLTEAVEAGDLEAVRRYLAEGADPNAVATNEWSLPTRAAWRGDFEVALLLLEAGARLSSVDADALLRTAVTFGRPDIVPSLIASRATIAAALDTILVTAVHASSSDWPARAQVAALEALIRAGADVDARLPWPYPRAVTMGETPIPAGAEAHDPGSEVRTPLIDAVEWGHRQFVEVLLRAGADVDMPGKSGRTPLISAVLRESRSRNHRMVRRLLKAGADPNVQDGEGSTALMYAISHSMDLKHAVRLVTDLLQAGADVNFRTETGVTALSLALRRGRGRDAVADLLRAAGASSGAS